MKTRTQWLIVVLLLALLLPSGMTARAAPAQSPMAFDCSTVTEIPQTECEALVALYNATDGGNWTNNTDWLVTNTPCSWYGLTCDSGHVSQVKLHANGLSGAVPPEIGNLTGLVDLTLNSNRLSGPIPSEIGNLTALTSLGLHACRLSGVIPPEIGNLTALTYLSLYGNQLSGSIPQEIGNLVALRDLLLDYNQLTGPIPPEIGNLRTLEWLYLRWNQLTGPIPPEIGNLTNLSRLSLYANQLIGPIPPEIGNLTALTNLEVNSNQLSGPIPPEIGDLTGLQQLNLANNLLTGSVPSEIGGLTSVRYLYLSMNQLNGLPSDIGNLSALLSLWLGDNQFSSLPPEIGNLTSIESLYLHNNPLGGELPTFVTALPLSTFTFYDTDWCVPAAGAVPTWLATVTSVYGTGLICGQDGGSLSGLVSLPSATPAAGVEVALYRPVVYNQWQHISTTHTIADGTYAFGGLGQGIGIDHRVRFVDPAFALAPQYYSAKPTIGTADVITITPGVPRTGIDGVLALPAPPAAGVETETGSVVYNADGTAQITMPKPDPSDITITRAVTCTVGVPSAVTLTLSIGPSYPMASLGGDLYRATVPGADLTANATLSVVATCGVTTTQSVVGYVTLYDPSGIISDEDTGLPVAGATVTLYQVPGWLPRTSPDDTSPNTCESNLSKAPGAPWSQSAPTDLGIIANAEVTAFAPAIAHQVSAPAGAYGWDVPEGCWYVTVSAEGYKPLVSPVVGVPPAVADLDLALTPVKEDYAIYLPLVLR